MHGSRNFRPVSTDRKKYVFLSPQIILQFYRGGGGPIQWFILRETIIFPKVPDGIQHFPGGWGGGGVVQMLISIETYRT